MTLPRRGFGRSLRVLPRSVLLGVIAMSIVVAGLLCAPRSTSAATSRATLAHHAVRTRSAVAQLAFDQGLTLLYAFNPEEALSHFQDAARADGNCAMAYWGIAMSAGPNVNIAYDMGRASIGRDAAAQAAILARGGSDEERLLIAAAAERYAVGSPDQIAGAQSAYAVAMGDIVRRYPADLDVAALYAESLMDLTPLDMWTREGKPKRFTERVIALLRGVLQRDPGHLAANHFIIHAYEGSRTPHLALENARRLAALSFEPAAEHLAHMPAHIFMRVGAYDEAIVAGRKAIVLARSYLARDPSAPHAGYLHHDLQVLGQAYAMSGQWAKARAVADEVAAQVGDSEAAAETYVRFRRWHELLALPAPANPGARWHFTRGMALCATGDVRAAEAELRTIEAARDNDPRTQIARSVLGASLAAAMHRSAEAIDDLRAAVRVQDGLMPAEPPKWFYPVRESLGGKLLVARRFAEARVVFDDDLRINPGNGRSLFGLSLALARTDPARKSSVDALFKTAWRAADTRLTVEDL